MPRHHREKHRSSRAGWLRAAVLGANDGIVSTSSLIVGVAASGAGRAAILTAGVAGLIGGAMSMAAGEYVSVSSQSDAQHADLDRERKELNTDPESERIELTGIYLRRGLQPELARTVAEQLMTHDALGAHARDELGISEVMTARPLQAALTSALTFAAGAALPLIPVMVLPRENLTFAVGISALTCLAGLGALAARAGGASPLRGAMRVTVWSAAAMLLTGAVGSLFG